MYPRLRSKVLIVLLMTLLSACSRVQSVASNVTPVVPATATPQATSRPAPKPTVVPTPHLNADASKNPVLLLQQAIEKTRTVTIYQLDFTNTYTPLAAGASTPVELHVGAEIDGMTVHTVYRSSQQPDDTYETIISGGAGYIRNTQAQQGAPDEWFISPNVLPGKREQLTPAALLDTFIGQKINLAEFARGKDDLFDSHQCTTYVSQGEAALRALNVLQGDASSSDTNINDHLTRHEMTFWVCDDSYVHQVAVALAGDNGKQPAQPMTYDMKLHLFNFNGGFHINPPSFALPLPPQSEQATQPTQPAPTTPAEQPPQSAQATPDAMTATVFNGGNVREVPVSGKPLDQINAHETVELRGKSSDGAWYFIRDMRGVTGWVSASLLTIAPQVAAQTAIVPSDTRGAAPDTQAAQPEQPSAPSLPIGKLVPFTHKPTGVSGLRPDNWQVFSGSNGFQISSSPGAPDGFAGIVTGPQHYVNGSAAQTSADMLKRFKNNQADGPAPQVLEEQIAADGSGTLLVNITGVAQGSSTPVRMTAYVRTTISVQGVLVAIATVPAAQYPAEAALVRQMVDSLKLDAGPQF